MSNFETLRIIHLDASGAVLGIAEYAGSRAAVAMPIRPIVADILRFNTRGLMMSHNHPSGDPTPSRADIAATHSLLQLVRALGVHLHDHLIIGAQGRFSFRAMGLL